MLENNKSFFRRHIGNSVEELKEILERFSLTKEEESSDVSSITPEQ